MSNFLLQKNAGLQIFKASKLFDTHCQFHLCLLNYLNAIYLDNVS